MIITLVEAVYDISFSSSPSFNFFCLQIDRRSQVDLISRHRWCTGMRAWRKLIHCLIEMKCLFGPFEDHLSNPPRVCCETYSAILMY